jgi:putative membrane protein insertion efficiency factor
MKWPRRVVAALLWIHQRVLSPLLPPACRFSPTCSEYARQAVERYGVRRGGALALRRLVRCHPFVEGGLDPLR